MKTIIQLFDDKDFFNTAISPWIDKPEDWALQVKEVLQERIMPQFEEIRRAPPSWSGTYLPMVRICSILETLNMLIGLNNTVFYSSIGLPDAIKKVGVLIDDGRHKISNDLMLMRKFRDLHAEKNLSEAKRYTLNVWLNDYFEQRLSRPRRARVNKMYGHIDRLTNQFMDNIRQAPEKNKYSLMVEEKDTKRLDGLHDDIINLGRTNAQKLGKMGFVFYPDDFTFDAFMVGCHSRLLRRRMFTLHSKLNSDLRGEFNNDALLRKILQKKQFVARMHGYDSYANLVLSRYVISDVAKADTYLDGLLKQVEPMHALVMRDCMREASAEGLHILKPWDIPFYYEKVKDKFNSNVTKNFSEYFHWRDFFPKLLKMIEQQFDLKIVKIKDHPLLEKDRHIQMYEVSDNQSSRKGFWFVDPMCRKNKGDEYWFDQELREHHPLSCGHATLTSYISFQLSRSRGNPSMSHGEVSCVLHEMGHCLDAFFSKRDGSMMISSNMGWDLVEMPSQFLEHWSYDSEVMRRLSKHHSTGKSIPPSLIAATLEDEQAFQGHDMYSKIMGHRETLFLHHHFGPYSKKAPSRMVMANLQKEGIFFNVARDASMASNRHEYEYGPCGYIYLFAGGVAFQLYQQWQNAGGLANPQNARDIFTKIFNTRSTKLFGEHLDQYVSMNSMNALEYLKKNLPIEIYGRHNPEAATPVLVENEIYTDADSSNKKEKHVKVRFN